MTVFVLPSGYLRVLRVGCGVYRLCRSYHDYVFGLVVYVWWGVGNGLLCVSVFCGWTMVVLVCLPDVVVVYTMVVCMVPVLRRLGNV